MITLITQQICNHDIIRVMYDSDEKKYYYELFKLSTLISYFTSCLFVSENEARMAAFKNLGEDYKE